jgi:hypothetical protein
MKRYTILLLMFASATAIAQSKDEDVKKKAAEGTKIKEIKDTGWVRGGFFSTNLSATSFSNWSQGGTNNMALVANSSLFAIYRSADGKGIWENYLDMAYGVIRNGESKIQDPGDPEKRIKNPFVKNEDKLVFLTKYGRRISDKLNYTAMLSLNTQMLPGWAADDILQRNSHVSNFMAQGFGYLSIGIDYKPRPHLSVYASPLTAKYTLVREQRLADLGLYGVRGAEYETDSSGAVIRKIRDGQKLRTELGWYINITFNKEVAKNITYQSRLEFFENYNDVPAFRQIDMNWQNTVNMKVNKYVSVVLINQVIWDYDVDTRGAEEGLQRNWQLKNFFGVGFSAKFGDKL